MKAYVTQSIIPMYRDPDYQSELINEILFGELIELNGSYGDWTKVKCLFYDYEGWICSYAFDILNEDDDISKYKTITSITALIEIKDQIMCVSKGARIYDFMKINIVDGKFRENNTKISVGNIIEDAQSLLFSPYRWGGKTPFGVDCSGFVQLVFYVNNIILPRDAKEQSKIGEARIFAHDAYPGDLAFFGNIVYDEENQREIININHVGIVLNNSTIIHAFKSVHIDMFDHYGIYSENLKKYTHQLMFTKKVLE
ncbi:MAG: C40 family peptidase [Bacteroidales bacterium]|jgi:hypothetical protein|nr:C40 family peptidase [Bacteroidales bacterium]MDI9575503.1 C40 family peptidase [Bacteroidota bacterium]MDD2593244.1 C40 family peptidase [Bacteroidales bacterium]MDD3755298.1 C40 family peptidase [Bacteroidales bacterium]MDY0400902.1 C40 family peptidase [Bacteroidales bacterium]